MEKTEILSYCISVFSSLSDAIERYPEVKEDLLRRTGTQRDDNGDEFTPASSEVNTKNVSTTPNSDSGFNQDSDREVSTYSSATSSLQFHHQSAFSTYHQADVAQSRPENFLANTQSICQHRSAFSPYVRPPSCHIKAANELPTVDSSQCSSSPIYQHSNIWRPF